MQAVLRIPSALPAEALNASAIMELLEDTGIPTGDDTRAAVESAIRQFTECPRELRVVVAQGVPPRRGADGRLAWEEGFGPTATGPPDESAEPEPPADQPVNFYEQSPFVCVKDGEHLATLIEPEPGLPGFDVFGKRIPPIAGKPFPLRFDPTVRIDGAGRVKAAQAGLLSCGYNTVHVSPVLEIAQSVDFATGNVRFDGSVTVGGGVCDRFTVETTEDVIVNGLIEAAHVRCGGTLRAEGGMAGREAGSVDVDRDLFARYLIGVHGRVGRDLVVQRELINCDLDIGGMLDLSGGSVIGGRYAVDGPVKVAALGSDAGVPTTVRLGRVPSLTEMLNKLTPALAQVDDQLQAMRLRQEAAAVRATGDAGEEQRLRRAVGELAQRRDKVAESVRQLREKFNRTCRIELEVFRTIHPGVTLVLPRAQVRFHEPLNGPVVIRRTTDGRLHIEHTDGQDFDLSAVATVGSTPTW